MQFLRHQGKRIVTDTAGYLLILLGLALGWLPGPGGIPLIAAGLGLLSINNKWAARLRDRLLTHGGKLVQILFPAHAFVQFLYDALVLVLLGLVTWLAFRHVAVWEISIAAAAFFLAVFVALMNRDRYNRLKHKLKRK